jgi:signal transduction histidine kinase
MIYALFLLLFVAIVCFLIGISIFIKSKDSILYKRFSFLIISSSIWALLIFLFYITNFNYLFAYLYYLSAISILIFMIKFTKGFPFYKKEKSTIINLVLYLLFLFFIIVLPFKGISFIYDIDYPSFLPNTLYIIYTSVLILLALYSILNIVISYKNLTGIYKMQTKYIISSILPALFIGLIFNLIIPLFGNYSLIMIGPIGLLVFILPIYESMSKYQFWGGTYLINKITEYLFLIILTFGLFYASIIVERFFFGSVFTLYSYIFGLFLALLYVFIFSLVSKRFEAVKFKSEIVFNQLKDYLLVETDVADIINNISEKMKVALNVEYIEIFFHNECDYNVTILNDLLKEYHGVLFLEEILIDKNKEFKKEEKEVIKTLLEKKILVLISNNEIYIFIHNKKNIKPINTQEKYLILDFSRYLFIAFQKIDLIINLQEKVSEATKELENNNKKLEKANEDLKGLDQLKDDLISISSHELRTPASIVKGNVYMAQSAIQSYIDTLPKSQQNNEYIEKLSRYIQRSIESIESEIRLINTLLEASRMGKSDIPIIPENLDIVSMIESQADGFKKEANNKGLRLIYHKKEIPMIYGDRTKVEEIIGNLISNAIKYSERGSIDIRTEEDKEYVTVHIKDNGVGIPEEEIPLLFQKFHRLNNYIGNPNDPKDRKHLLVRPGGTGLGLYVVKGLVERMGGKIWIDSIVGEGSTFSFTLPIAKDIKKENNDSFKSQDVFKKLKLK